MSENLGPPPKVMFVTPTAENARYYEYYDSLARIMRPPGADWLPVHGPSPARNRNIAIKTTLSRNRKRPSGTPKYSHIFFMDDDHVYDLRDGYAGRAG